MVQIKRGTFSTTSGTSAKNIDCGFIPAFVQIWNDGTGASNVDSYVWFHDMTDAYGFKAVAAGNNTYITSGGIAAYDTLFKGFTVPAGIQGAADVFWYVAFGPGSFENHGDLD